MGADLPYGTLIIKDILATSGGWQEESRQETSETRLNYHLQAEGCMTVSTGTGRDGANQLVADLDFTLTAYIGSAIGTIISTSALLTFSPKWKLEFALLLPYHIFLLVQWWSVQSLNAPLFFA